VSTEPTADPAVGTSLRDPSIIQLLDAVGPFLLGWAVKSEPSEADCSRLERWSLRPIDSTADEFFIAPDAELGR